MKTKQFTATDMTVDEATREVVAIISTDSVDRDKEVVLPSGLDKKNYGGNPVVLYGHDWQGLPIGTTRWVKQQGGQLIAKYYISDKTEFARDVFGLLQDGVLKAHSIGFNVLEASEPTTREIKKRPDWADAKNVIRKWELLEFSVVAIPANPDAIALAVAKGLSEDTRQHLGKTWEPRKTVIEWDEEEKTIIEKPVPIKRDTTELKKRLKRFIDGLDIEQEIIARLTGKA